MFLTRAITWVALFGRKLKLRDERGPSTVELTNVIGGSFLLCMLRVCFLCFISCLLTCCALQNVFACGRQIGELRVFPYVLCCVMVCWPSDYAEHPGGLLDRVWHFVRTHRRQHPGPPTSKGIVFPPCPVTLGCGPVYSGYCSVDCPESVSAKHTSFVAQCLVSGNY